MRSELFTVKHSPAPCCSSRWRLGRYCPRPKTPSRPVEKTEPRALGEQIYERGRCCCAFSEQCVRTFVNSDGHPVIRKRRSQMKMKCEVNHALVRMPMGDNNETWNARRNDVELNKLQRASCTLFICCHERPSARVRDVCSQCLKNAKFLCETRWLKNCTW